MPLKTIMYHFVYEQVPSDLLGIPHVSIDDLQRQIALMVEKGTLLTKGEDVRQFIGAEDPDRFLLTFGDALWCYMTEFFRCWKN